MKTYYLQFGSGDPRTFTGLAPTLLSFTRFDGVAVTPPAVAEVAVGTGIYNFSYGTTQSIAFLADAATTSPGPVGRYVFGALDPADRIDEIGSTLIAIGTSTIALGVTGVALGTTAVALGTTAVALGTTSVALGTTSVALGTSNLALGTTILSVVNTILIQGITVTAVVTGIGSVGSTFGGVGTNPIDLFGYMKRIQENLEGNMSYQKVSGALTILSRGGSFTLANKTVTNSITMTIKT